MADDRFDSFILRSNGPSELVKGDVGCSTSVIQTCLGLRSPTSLAVSPPQYDHGSAGKINSDDIVFRLILDDRLGQVALVRCQPIVTAETVFICVE